MPTAPLWNGSLPRYLGLTGSVTSTNAVLFEPGSTANSRPVVESVQPQMSKAPGPPVPPKVTGPPPMALVGRYASSSTFRQSKIRILPPVQGIARPVRGWEVLQGELATDVSCAWT